MSQLRAVPAGGRLVHIGFDKTGTTSLQGAFHRDRDRLRSLGVIYPGAERYHKSAGVAVTEARGNTGDRPVTMADWEELVGEVAAAPPVPRVFISSEWLCRADDKQAQRVVGELGGQAVRIVATLRPLAKILPSAWQQYVKDGFTGDYEPWLRGMLLEAPYQQPTPWFWIRHSHDRVLGRWAKLVGAENVTAIVVSESDRELMFRQFEQLLGLAPRTLLPEPESKQNSSLTWPEAQMLRRVNQAFRDNGWSDASYGLVIRSGLTPRLAAARAAAADESAAIPTPPWALERAAEIGAAAAAAIRALGVCVVGDLDSLGRPAADEPGGTPPALVPARSVAQAIAGVLIAAQRSPQPTSETRAGSRPISPLPEF